MTDHDLSVDIDPEVQKNAMNELVRAISHAIKNGITLEDIKNILKLRAEENQGCLPGGVVPCQHPLLNAEISHTIF